MTAREIHPYAELFPPMEGEEFDELVKDVKANGLLEPVVLFEGKVLDGRNRLRACDGAGVVPRFEEYKGPDALSYVVSKNVRRRHLTASQRAVISLDAEKMFAEEAARQQAAKPRVSGTFAPRPPGSQKISVEKNAATSAAKAGRLFGISKGTVDRAKRVARDRPDLIPVIRRGELSVGRAERKVTRKRSVQPAGPAAQENPREVKEYLDAIKTFKRALEEFTQAARTAARVAGSGKFSPETQRFTKQWHGEITKYWQDDLLALIEAVEKEFNAASNAVVR